MSGEQFFFWLFALITCGGAFAVVASQNVVRMAFWLVVSLGSTAAFYFMLYADFVGATQLLIYVGGTVVVLIFGVMLTASGPYVKIKTAPSDLFMSAGVGLVVLFLLVSTVTAVPWGGVHDKFVDNELATGDYPPELPPGYNDPSQGNTARPIGLLLLGLNLKDVGSTSGTLSTGYLLPFEIVSIHLLVVLVGASYLARAKRRVATDDVSATEIVAPRLSTVPARADNYASFFRRAGALLIDTLVISIVQISLLYFWWPPSTAFSAIGAIIVFLYFAGMESSAYQGTIGKIVLRVAVTDMNGETITFGRALIRNLLKYVSGMILLIGYLMAAFTKRRQALHDLLAKTLVVNR